MVRDEYAKDIAKFQLFYILILTEGGFLTSLSGVEDEKIEVVYYTRKMAMTL